MNYSCTREAAKPKRNARVVLLVECLAIFPSATITELKTMSQLIFLRDSKGINDVKAVICSRYCVCKSDSLQILFFFPNKIVLLNKCSPSLNVDCKTFYVIFNRLCKLSFSIETKIVANFEVKKYNSVGSEA